MRRILANTLLIALLFAVPAAKSHAKGPANKNTAASAKLQTFDGWISDEKCGAKVDADCAKKCQALGVKMVFVTSEKTVVPVANQEALKNFAGQHVSIKGKLENGVLTVASVQAAK